MIIVEEIAAVLLGSADVQSLVATVKKIYSCNQEETFLKPRSPMLHQGKTNS